MSVAKEHYTRISPNESTHRHPDCGCSLKRDDVGSVALYQCQIHAAAPELRLLLDMAVSMTARKHWAKRADALLAKLTPPDVRDVIRRAVLLAQPPKKRRSA